MQQEHAGLKATEVTFTDAKTYRDHLLTKRYAPTTINRALISLMLFFDTIGKTNPFRHLTMIDIVEPAPVALSKTEWNSVRRCAEAAARRDRGLAFALATLFRYAGPRVSEVAALQIPDVQVSARRGLLVVRRGKGLKHREIPLVQEAREPLEAYFTYRKHLAERWREWATIQGEAVAAWSRWPDGHLFLGQRGPLAERGIREIIAKLGQAAKLASPLGPHDLRHTFAKGGRPVTCFTPMEPSNWQTLLSTPHGAPTLLTDRRSYSRSNDVFRGGTFMLIVNDDHRLRAGVCSLNDLCPYCGDAFADYPLVMSGDPAQTVYHIACALELATDLLVDLYTFFSPPAPYDRLFTLATSAPTLYSEGGGNASNQS